MKNEDIKAVRISEALNNSGAELWKTVFTDTDSYEMFFVHNKLETVRRAESGETVVTVYSEHDGKLGSSSFKVYSSTTNEELSGKIASALEKSVMIYDEMYKLPENETGIYEIESNLNGIDPEKLGADAAEAVFAARMKENCAVNALEVFVKKQTVRVVNSRGIDKTQTMNSVSIEAIPTCNGKEESVELYEYYNIAEIDKEALTSEVSAKMEDVYSRSIAKKPEDKIDCPVLLGAGELKEFFGTLIEEMNYSVIYNHGNIHSEGDMIQKAPAGDSITIDVRNIVKGSVRSRYFDNDGTQLVSRRIVDNGKIIGGYGSYRFSQYLGKETTGDISCFEVTPGKSSENELRLKPYLECVYLSGLQVDPYNDYIGGEVRLAYYYDGKKKIPITGISISGKLSEIIETVRLSSERTVNGGYFGPKIASFEKMTII